MKRRGLLNKALNRVALGVVASSVVELSDLWSVALSLFSSEPTRPTPIDTGDSVARERTADGYAMTYEWTDWSGREWRLEFPIERSAYREAADDTHGYLSGFEAAKGSAHAKRLTEALVNESATSKDTRRSLPESVLLDRAIGLVHSLEYATDAESTGVPDYIRTVEETLVDGCGDCEDLTYLLVAMLSQPAFGYRTAMVILPGHMLAGVHRDDLPEVYADAPTLPGGTYVAIECTTSRPIGEFKHKPVLAVYGDDVEYIDRSAIANTGEEFLKHPTQFQTIADASAKRPH
ncbi:hypothetical protein EXE51_06540 [Halorubrum sp. CGM5_25_10-8B]|uniref:hypothetical protein n=1 Tax=Halorubrum TaxID=56688 RepID=UPI0010F74CE9|nr:MULTISPECIES: hypothetical protein [Halorubrum]MDB9302166.1 hypothetical protein [Halorubrum ezzemoulense]TKX37773.1 hypothetical protein EXE51_06540 [Halorubrum sp. CGM5_25_10-8B]